MGHKGAPNNNCHLDTVNILNWPKIGPQVDQDSGGSSHLYLPGALTSFTTVSNTNNTKKVKVILTFYVYHLKSFKIHVHPLFRFYPECLHL